jgi:hypothetical protein
MGQLTGFSFYALGERLERLAQGVAHLDGVRFGVLDTFDFIDKGPR